MPEQEVTEAATEAVTAAEAFKDMGTGILKETDNMFHISEFKSLFTPENIVHIITSAVALVIFILVYLLIKRVVNKHALKKSNAHTKMLINKIMKYVFYVLIVMYVLSSFGVNLNAIWGAAGVAGVAIGFAAQTSVSNFISGLFVLGEKSMKIGDYITVDGVSGNVHSIGLLSVQIKTLDNQMIRIPTSTIINTTLQNYNHFPVRRFVFDIPVSYETDMTKALEAIKKVPEKCPSVLTDPAPAVFYDGFGDAVNLKLAMWFNNGDLVKVKNEAYIAIRKVCDEEGVIIPYSRIDVKIVNADEMVNK